MARRGIRLLASLVAASTALAVTSATSATAGAAGGSRAARAGLLHGVNVLGRDLDVPIAVAADASGVWVLNAGNGTVTMLDPKTGLTSSTTDVGTIGVQSPGAPPAALEADGVHVWVTDGSADTVTELSATSGAVLRVLRARAYELDRPAAVAGDGTDAWIVDKAGDAVTEVNASTGALVRVLHGTPFGFDAPDAIGFDGTNLWVLNSGDGSITEFGAASGALVEQIPASGFDGSAPSALAVVGSRLWVVDAGSDEISVLSTSTGALVATIEGGASSFLAATGLAVAGADVWVIGSSPTAGRQLTELRASSGHVVRVVHQPALTPWRAAAADDGAHLWVLDVEGNGVTELSNASGGTVRVTYGAPYELSTPGAIASIHGHVWVANEGSPSAIGESLLEFSATTGAFLHEVQGLTVAAPRELTACGGHLWLGSGYGSIVELSASTGFALKTIDEPDFRYANVQAFTCAGADLWVVNTHLAPHRDTTRLDELSAVSGAVLRRIVLPGQGAAYANAIAVDDGDVWVTASSRDSLTVVDATTGAIVRTELDTGVLRNGGAVLADGPNVFVVDFNAVVEFDAANGSVVRVVRGAQYRFDLPFALVAVGRSLFVVNAGNSVTALSTRNGALLHVFRGAPYAFDDPVCATLAGANLWVGNALGQSITEFPAT